MGWSSAVGALQGEVDGGADARQADGRAAVRLTGYEGHWPHDPREYQHSRGEADLRHPEVYQTVSLARCGACGCMEAWDPQARKFIHDCPRKGVST